MHNNYYFIRKLVPELKSLLHGSVLMECYSQNKEELILSFLGDNRRETHIVASLGSEFSCLHFPKEYHRAKKNSVSLFKEIIGLRVADIIQIPNERLFIIEFTEDYRLAFKLFGNRANVILFRKSELINVFKNNLRQDKGLVIKEEGREIDFSFENFKEQGYNFQNTFFTLGKIPETYLHQKGYEEMEPEEKYQLIVDMLQKLENPEFYISRINEKVVLSLLNFGEVINKYSSSIEAVNSFYIAHFKYNYLEQQKLRLLALLETKLKSGLHYVEKSNQKILDLSDQFPAEKMADIIMANLHAISPGSEKVVLFDFYRNRDIEINLKKDITPQKNAEALYKKSKKRPAEIERLKDQIRIKEGELNILNEDKSKIENIESHKELESYIKKYILAPEKEKEESSAKFKEFEFKGYKIFVGRNAENNDELTQKYAGKDDLWFHAKDVQGSHVVVKFRSGQNFPKDVIERAASIAAFYSKRKNESLCPVIYTQKKNVRKVKGAPKGAVRVDKESIIMVEPREF